MSRKRRAIAVAVLLVGAALAHIALAPTALRTPQGPPPPAERPVRGEIASTWTKRTARLTAVRVDIDTVGAHTHANWVYFRLPFETTDFTRVRELHVTPSAAVDPDVAAAIVLGTCLPYSRFGSLASWGMYTLTGIGETLPMSHHVAPPTSDPTILAINVPSRVANYVACGWKNSDRLRDPSTWSIDITWEER